MAAKTAKAAKVVGYAAVIVWITALYAGFMAGSFSWDSLPAAQVWSFRAMILAAWSGSVAAVAWMIADS